jgi:DNA adenine methylase
MKSPYPYFGGKSSVAQIVWERLGNVPNYVEPFLGSAAVLLARPADHLKEPRIETVNDKDGFISNFWRAVQADSEAVARWADWPVNENDLHARHAWLVGKRDSLVEWLEGDPDYFDPQIAGWWVWGMSLWIGGNFCSGEGPWVQVGGKLISVHDNETGVSRKRPSLGNAGRGIKRQRPDLQRENSRGIKRTMPALSGAAKGIQRRRVHLKASIGINRQSDNTLQEYIGALSSRLRRVRVCSGDWSRVTGETPTTRNGLTGVFLDPPYIHERATDIYTHDDPNIASDVRKWAIAHGDDPKFRIAYCGYEDGFAWPSGWVAYRWQTQGGFSHQGNGKGKVNRYREVVWFSPHCLNPDELPLFKYMQQEGEMMKCLSLWQPWATLIMTAWKNVETRSWQTSYRGPMVIHAAKTTVEAAYMFDSPEFHKALTQAGYRTWEDLPFGMALGVVDLIGIERTEDARHISRTERAFGDYDDGRFAWYLANPRPFQQPIPMRGYQGLFDTPIVIPPLTAIGEHGYARRDTTK